MSKRASKPTALRSLEGGRSNSLPKPDQVKEPKPLPKAPQCPSDIDTEAKQVWKKLAPKLERLGLLTEIDGDVFAMLCQMRSRLAAIHRFNKSKVGKSLVMEKVTIDGSGQEHVELKQSPYAMMERQLYPIFRQFAKDFGLTPVGRVGLSVGSEKEDEGADLLTQ